MEKDSKIYVAGHRGLVGSGILRRLQKDGYENVVTREHLALDLTNQASVREFFYDESPEYVFLAAAKVGGILSNSEHPARFIYENIMIQSNVIHASYIRGVKKLLFLGSSCIYPKHCHQPIDEASLLSGKLESSNEPYAIAKIAGIKMCQAYNKEYGTNFISAIPANIYGPNNDCGSETSHVLQALIRKIHEAKMAGYGKIDIWGSGIPKREFLYVDDLSDACLFLMENYNNSEAINVGTGKDISILELAHLISDIIGYDGFFGFDKEKPDGHMSKLLDISEMRSYGWEPLTSLRDGIAATYKWYLEKILSWGVK